MAAKRVLIVDDATEVRADLRTALLLVSNIEIIGEATNGLEAVQQAALLQPEVVLMDLEMPMLDGYEATQQIKTHWPGCRVIALTVHGYETARQKALQAGVDAFIVKGAPVENLIRAISEGKE